MIYKFSAYGHPNILATHKTTLEFTKDEELSLKGDCIVGIKADFDLKELVDLIRNSNKNNDKKVTIKIMSKNKKIQEKMYAELNPSFNHNKELVIRKSDFVSDRTLAISSNKAAFDLNRDLIDFLRDKKNKVSVIIENKQK